MKRFFLLVLCLTSIPCLYAARTQSISFIWGGIESHKSFSITANGEESFTVYWGDESSSIYSGKGDTVILCNHSYMQPAKEYRVLVIGKRRSCEFATLNIQNQQLRKLDISESKSLVELNCANNTLSSLDIHQNQRLRTLDCRNNALPLAVLTLISEEVKNAKLGQQFLPSDTIVVDTKANYIRQSDITDKNTIYTIRKGDVEAVKNTDYVFQDEDIIFKKRGVYLIELTSKTIPFSGFPVKVTDTVMVVQQIGFTWEGSTDTSSFQIRTNQGKKFHVDWGDGLTSVYTGKGKNTVMCNHTYTRPDMYNVNVYTKDGDFSQWAANSSKITSVQFRGCNALTDISCSDNQITTINTKDCKALKRISCYKNNLSLPQLFEISNQLKESDRKYLGMHYLALDTIAVDQTLDYGYLLEFAGIDTRFVFYKGDKEAVEGIDYTFSEGILVFKNEGIYAVAMTNNAIVSSENYPAQVMAMYVVGQQIAFTWQADGEKKMFEIAISEGNTFVVDWGDGSHDIYDVQEDVLFSCSHLYSEENQYHVLIRTTDAVFNKLLCGNNKISDLYLEGAPDLDELDCSFNRLTTLDISSCKKLQQISCQNNQLPLSELYPISMRVGTPYTLKIGDQIIPTTYVSLGAEIDLCFETDFNAIPTKFTVYKENFLARKGVDYQILDHHIIILKTEGVFKLEMENDAIISSRSYPARVTNNYIVSIIGEHEFHSDDFKVYPNPTRDMLWIDMQAQDEEILPEVKVYSQTGELLVHTKALSLNLSSFVDGEYFVQVNGKVIKVMKRK